MNEFSEILKSAGDAGAVIVLVIALTIITRVVMRGAVSIAEVWSKIAQARMDVDAERNRIDGKMADALSEFGRALTNLNTSHEATHSLIAASAQESRVAHGTHQSSIERLEGAIAKTAEAANSEAAKGNNQRKRIEDTLQENHGAVITRLDAHQSQIETLINTIKAAAIPEAIRGDITRLIFLATGISDDVKKLVGKGEEKAGENVSDKTAQEKQ